MSFKFKFFLFVLSAVFLFGNSAVLATSNLNLGLDVYTCNNNTVCDTGETTASCPADCPASVCNNNGVCETGEDASNCPADCHGNPPLHVLTISSISVVSTTNSSARINWKTNYEATCRLSWDLSVNNDYSLGFSQEISGYNQLNHSIPLTGLTASTTYYFKIYCIDTSSYEATVLDNSFNTVADLIDVTAPGPITNLTATPGDKHIFLSWINPTDDDFAGVVIKRSTSSMPNISEGIEVYRGFGDIFGSKVSFDDTGLTNGVLYYYSVFAYDNATTPNYSTGVGTSATPNEETIPPITTTTPPITTSTPPHTTSTPPHGTQDLLFRDFDFYQNDLQSPVQSDDLVLLALDQEVAVSLSIGKILIGTDKMVLNLSIDGGIVSYLFAPDPNNNRYIVTLPSFVTAGKYWVTIVVLDSNSQVIKSVAGTLEVKEPQIIEIPSVIDNVTDQLVKPIAGAVKPIQELAKSPVGQAAAVAVAVASIANVVIAVPWWNLWTLLQFMFTQPIIFFFRRKRWGTIYNSITKKPVDLALVRLFDAKTNLLITSRVTDRAGRYSFLVDPGEYYLRIEKPNFEFPSVLLRHASDDGNFVDLYYGDKIVVTHEGRSAIIANIPIDPMDVKITDAEIIRKISKERLTRHLSWVGPILALIYFALFPSIYAGIIVVIHLLIRLIFGRLSAKRSGKYWGVVYDKRKNKPIKKAVTRVYSSEYGRMLEFYVTDNRGRYNFLVGDNKYYVTGDKEGYETSKTPIIDLSKAGGESAYIAQDLSLAPVDNSAVNSSVEPQNGAGEEIQAETDNPAGSDQSGLEGPIEAPETPSGTPVEAPKTGLEASSEPTSQNTKIE